jgi:PKD repeat protein
MLGKLCRVGVAAALCVVTPGCEDDDDSDGPTGSSRALTLSCSAEPTSGRVPLAVAFKAMPSGGSGNYVVSWSFGDGSGASVLEQTRTYLAPGVYTATAEVVSGSQRASCSLTITAQAVPAPPPAPNASPVGVFKTSPSPPTGSKPLTVTFNACQSSDPDGDRIFFLFDVGEGRGLEPGGTCRRTHVYRVAGSFSARVCITDNAPGRADVCQGYTVRAQ